MDLPLEIFNIVLQDISFQDKLNMATTDKKVRAYMEPHLYRNLYTKIHSRYNTKGLVNLLKKRPQIASMIHCLNLDEFEPSQTRRLLSITMPNLTVLQIQHRGEIVQTITAKGKRHLNKEIRPQPGLRNRECI